MLMDVNVGIVGYNKYFAENMPKNVSWLPEEDSIIFQLATKQLNQSANGTVSWQEVARLLQQQFHSQKNARQCQHRWNYSLRPGITKDNDWTETQQNLLLELQEIHGNKWTLIAERLGGKAEHQVKNQFYATLRKSIRVVNSSIQTHRAEPFFKGRKLFAETCITKVVSLDQGRFKRLKASRDDIPKLARAIKVNLFRLAHSQNDMDLLKITIVQLTDFNRNCRKLKGKKNRVRFNNSSDSSFEEAKTTSQLSTQQYSRTPNTFLEDFSEEVFESMRDSNPMSLMESTPLSSMWQQSEEINQEKEIIINTSDFWKTEKIDQDRCFTKEDPFKKEVEGKKDWLSLQRTRDMEEEEEKNKMQDGDEMEVENEWDLELPIDGILNLPNFEDLLDRREENNFILFQEGHDKERRFDTEQIEFEEEYPFNEYFC